MSQQQQPGEYFHCPKMGVTLPVEDCASRRAKTLAQMPQGAPWSLVQCIRCTEWREHTALDKRITREKVMGEIEANPSQPAGKTHRSNAAMAQPLTIRSGMLPYYYGERTLNGK